MKMFQKFGFLGTQPLGWGRPLKFFTWSWIKFSSPCYNSCSSDHENFPTLAALPLG